MALQIRAPDDAPLSKPACLYLDSHQQTCWPELPKALTVDVTLNNDTTLTLQQPDGAVLLTRALQVKARQTSTRRRIRSPWRLF